MPGMGLERSSVSTDFLGKFYVYHARKPAVNPWEIAVFGEHRIGRFGGKRGFNLRMVRCRQPLREFARPPIDGKEV